MSTDATPIHQGHRNRLRRRYLSSGPDGFADHELLELLLGFCIPQKDTNPIAHDLIARFGSFRGVLDADPEELTRVESVGSYCVFLLKLLPALSRRYYEELSTDHLRFLESDRIVEFFIPRFIGRREECLYAAFLDENRRLINCSLQYIGSISAVEIHAAKVLETARRTGCKSVVIAHNHFNDCVPSVQDLAATRDVFRALSKAGFRLLDHIIVCGNEGLSLQEGGYFEKLHF